MNRSEKILRTLDIFEYIHGAEPIGIQSFCMQNSDVKRFRVRLFGNDQVTQNSALSQYGDAFPTIEDAEDDLLKRAIAEAKAKIDRLALEQKAMSEMIEAIKSSVGIE